MPLTRWITGPEIFQTWAGPWEALVDAAGNATPFQTLEWQRTWFDHFGGRKQPCALAAFEGEDLVGWWPMVRSHGAWPTLRPMGKGASDYLHPLIHRQSEGVAVAMAEALNQAGAPLIDLHQVREDLAPGLGEGLLGSHVIPQATCLVLELPRDYETYLKSLGKSLRYDVRRLQKEPFSTGEAKIELATPENVSTSLEHLFRLHALRWRKRWQPGAFPAPLRRFHLAWAAQAVQRGWLELSTLIYEGEPIGALYAMKLNGVTYYYQAGMDPARNAVSPGSLLVAESIRRAIERGDTHFDFLRGDEAYKRRWKPQHEHQNVRYLLGDSSKRSQLGKRWNVLGSRVEANVRARLEAR